MKQKVRLDNLTIKSVEELMQNNPEELCRLIDGLMEKQYTIADIDIDHRVVTHWEKERILDKTKEIKDRWRRYSFMDYVWLRMLIDIREFGLPIPVIKKVKNSLFIPVYELLFSQVTKKVEKKIDRMLDDDGRKIIKKIKRLKQEPDQDLHDKLAFFTHFDFAILNIIVTRTPAYLLITKEGETTLAFMGEPNLSLKKKELLQMFEKESLLSINISRIIDDFFSEDNISDATLYKLSPLTEQEKEIMNTICAGGVKTVHIKLKDGTDFFTEIMRKKPAKFIVEQIKVFIARKKYSSISLESEKETKVYTNQFK